MNNRAKRIACLASMFAGLMCSTAAVAGGNGSGNEPPQSERESAVTICSIAPWMCISSTQGNGSGNEPPQM